MEMLGTLFLCMIGGCSVYAANNSYASTSLMNISIAHGMILFIMIAVGGSVSGGQYNPAVTIALIAYKELPVTKGLLYIAAQMTGSIAAGWFLQNALPNANLSNKNYGTSPTLNVTLKIYEGFIMEFIATFMLVTAVFTGIRRGQGEVQIGINVGIVLVLFINCIGAYTGASLNPARTLGPYCFSSGWKPINNKYQPFSVYYIAPILGGLAAGFLSKYYIHSDEQLAEIEAANKPSNETKSNAKTYDMEIQDNDGPARL
jgi:MIP family channel proteins